MQSSWQDPPQYSGGMHFAMPTATPVVKLLLIANGAVFLLTFLIFFVSTPAWYGGDGLGLVDVVGLQPQAWRDWFPFVPLWQLVTYGFCHSPTDLMHIVGNMLFLFFLGSLLERLIGGRRFLVLYGSAIVVAGIAQLVLGLLLGESVPTVGASGAVLAIVIAAAVLRPDARIIFILFPITLRTLAILYVAFDVFGALMNLKGAGGGVAHVAHLAGAAWGFGLARSGWIWRDPMRQVAEWRARRSEEQAVDDARRVDDLLAKISREGIHSLSSSEKSFLKRASRR